MPAVFSYGSLQDEYVQMRTVGRRLSGVRDELAGYALTKHGPWFNVQRDEAERVPGTRYEISDDELAIFDRYEGEDDYVRIEVELASGERAWVYLYDR